MFIASIGFVAASFCVLLWELRHAPEGTEDHNGLTIVQPKEPASDPSTGESRPLLAHH